MYMPATTSRQREAIRAANEARAEAISEFWSRVSPWRK